MSDSDVLLGPQHAVHRLTRSSNLNEIARLSNDHNILVCESRRHGESRDQIIERRDHVTRNPHYELISQLPLARARIYRATGFAPTRPVLRRPTANVVSQELYFVRRLAERYQRSTAASHEATQLSVFAAGALTCARSALIHRHARLSF